MEIIFLMMEHGKKFKGELNIYKKYKTGKEELVYHTDNLTTLGFASRIGDLLTDPAISTDAFPYEIGYMQLGESSYGTYIDRGFYELASPFNSKDYGNFTNLRIENKDQVTVEEPFLKISDLKFTKRKADFIKLEEQWRTILYGNKLLIRLPLDEYTLNEKYITEAGLFFNNGQKDREEPVMIAYKAFGVEEGEGIPFAIYKTSEFSFELEWIISIIENELVTAVSFDTSSNSFLNLTSNVYYPKNINASGNSWVCYFPSPVSGDDPPTVNSPYVTSPKDNIRDDFVIRLVNKGIGVISCDYNYAANSLGSYPLLTPSVASNDALMASSITAVTSNNTPFSLSGDVRNSYTDAVKMAQFAKTVASSVGFTASSVIYAGEGFGGTLAAWLTYAPDLSGEVAGGSPTYPYALISTRGLGTAIKDAPLNWDKWWPFRLGASGSVYNFTPFAIPKALDMSGTVYGSGPTSYLQTSTTDTFTGDWSTSTFKQDTLFSSVSSAFGYTDENVNPSGNLYWSSIPGAKNSYQFLQIPTLSKQWHSPLYHSTLSGQASGTDPRGENVYWGHIDNSSTYFHADYAGKSLSALGGVYWASSTYYGDNLLPYPNALYDPAGWSKDTEGGCPILGPFLWPTMDPPAGLGFPDTVSLVLFTTAGYPDPMGNVCVPTSPSGAGKLRSTGFLTPVVGNTYIGACWFRVFYPLESLNEFTLSLVNTKSDSTDEQTDVAIYLYNTPGGGDVQEWYYFETPPLTITDSTGDTDDFRLEINRNHAASGNTPWASFYSIGASVHETSGSDYAFNVLSGVSLEQVTTSSYEPVINLHNAEYTVEHNMQTARGWDSSAFGFHLSSLMGAVSSTNNLEDPFYGLDLWSTLSSTGDHSTSSTFRHVNSTLERNNASNFGYPNTNESLLSAKARSDWILNLFAYYNSWYNQFL